MQSPLGPTHMRRSTQAGFTLIEMMIVVAIIAIVAAVAAWSLFRTEERISVERATTEIKSLFERARSLSAVAGSRVGTPRLNLLPSCVAPPTPNQLWININVAAGTVNYPSNVTYNAALDQLDVTCETWTLANEVKNGVVANFDPATTGPTQFAFAPSGRLVEPPGPAQGAVYVKVQSANEQKGWGFLVLGSGVMCQSDSGLGPPRQCDESVW